MSSFHLGKFAHCQNFYFQANLIDESRPDLLYRTDFFGGLGWMMTSELWTEIGPKWPRSYWDDWIRNPEQRRERACIRPEISRTRTFGKVGNASQKNLTWDGNSKE